MVLNSTERSLWRDQKVISSKMQFWPFIHALRAGKNHTELGFKEDIGFCFDWGRYAFYDSSSLQMFYSTLSFWMISRLSKSA